VRQARVRVDLNAIQHNFNIARRAAGSSKIMAVIKANAYGHDMEAVAKHLAQADGFAVANVAEGLALRNVIPDRMILVLQGAASMTDYQQSAEKNLTLVMHHGRQLEFFKTHNSAQPPLWLKLDSGMHRLGFTAEEFRMVKHLLGKHLTGMMTHFANADDPDHPANAEQLDRFNQACGNSQLPRSCANSAALLQLPEARMDWCRPGIMLYGGSPLLNKSSEALDLRAAMIVSAPLIAVKDYKQGDAIGYGGDFVCPHDMRVGVVAIGYADGYPRHAPTGTPVLIHGQECALIGRVSMDMITIDLTHAPQAQPGDEVVLWGAGLPVDRIAALARTISYDLLCAAGGVNVPQSPTEIPSSVITL
jgi:alanine racemase